MSLTHSAITMRSKTLYKSSIQIKTLATEYNVLTEDRVLVGDLNNINDNDYIEVRDRMQIRLDYNNSHKEIVIEEDFSNNSRSFEIWLRAKVISNLDSDIKIVSFGNTIKEASVNDIRLLTQGARLNHIIKKIELTEYCASVNFAEVQSILEEAEINYHINNSQIYLCGAKEDVCYTFNLILIRLNKLKKFRAIDDELSKQKENYLKLQKILQSNSKLLFNFSNNYLDAINKYVNTLTEKDNNISCFINDEPSDEDEFTLIIYGNNINKEYYTKTFDLKQDFVAFEPDLRDTIVKTDSIDSIRNLLSRSKVVRIAIT
jgi:hypothetical protein